ncbi:MAG: nucleotide exchange factor GrpE [Armatimonadetes bacterium]|nr:nucleotide exchange factor GrpE [Armatimonadota bacterium]
MSKKRYRPRRGHSPDPKGAAGAEEPGAAAHPETPGDQEPGPDTGAAHPPLAEELLKQVGRLDAELKETKDSLLRAVADLQNYRRRAGQQAAEARETAAADIAKRLLPVLDNFERTLAAAEQGSSLEALREGVGMIDRQLRDLLAEYRVTPIPALGLPFDPRLHEAVVTEESDDEPGTIIEEFERGYQIGRRVLRPTKAKVSRGSAKKSGTSEGPAT